MPVRLQRSSPETSWIKLCGIRDVETAQALAVLHPNALGLNFYKPSRRYIDLDAARAIQEALPEDVLGVGVFVNATADEIIKTLSHTGLRAIQLHGDEPATILAEIRDTLPEIAILRAWRVDETGLEPLADYLGQCDAPPDAVLIDASVAGEYGGTGQTAPWTVLRDYPADWPPLILAGGLHQDNVAEAIAAVRPFGIDTASGIESSPGVKDSSRAAAFVTAARLARRGSRP